MTSIIQKQIDGLLCDAFLGVSYTVKRTSYLAFYVIDSEERLVGIDEVITDLRKLKPSTIDSADLLQMEGFKQLGITDVVLTREGRSNEDH